ncbi:Endonuclease, Uma2 family (restriction endonuclease fold) [Lentzea fradiae]|uniref:Endonuclease, Uma2 family (Restriction endonuclease fold) n=1 Tax=Lentzea fradiae TaxID=200378 RepID=A0A1G7M665_9PSEU|nr:Uma2 family endonuclease [Lentzea fradiae]SDF57165.1 Endonuclease, Uma2 family (restriction endonuclease fold) [Lentzea fradiae]
MTAVTDLAHPIGPTTVDEWRSADHPDDGSQLELIWGYYHESPPPGGPHQYALGALYRALWQAVEGNDRLHAVTGVGIEISTAIRTALIPDVALLNTLPTTTSFPASALVLAVEIWSPGNNVHERETKVAGYAIAGVPYLWTVDMHAGRRAATLRAFELVGGTYRERTPMPTGDGAGRVVVQGPVEVSVDLASLVP